MWVVGRGSWVVGRGSWVVGRGSWVVGRGSWVVVSCVKYCSSSSSSSIVYIPYIYDDDVYACMLSGS